jgi:hypothetical protein
MKTLWIDLEGLKEIKYDSNKSIRVPGEVISPRAWAPSIHK